MLHSLLDCLAGGPASLYKICLAIGLLTLMLSYKNTMINPTFLEEDQPEGGGASPASSVGGLPRSQVLLPSTPSTSQSGLLKTTPPSILVESTTTTVLSPPAAPSSPSSSAAAPSATVLSSSSSSSASSSSSSIASTSVTSQPAGAKKSSTPISSSKPPIIITEHRKLETTALLALDPSNTVYRANHPYHVGEHTLPNIPTLASRAWPNITHNTSLSHVVLRLPSSQYAMDLRPLTRMVMSLSILLAAQEAGVASIEQIHFVSPVPGLKGATGHNFDKWTVNFMVQSPVELFTLAWDEETAAGGGKKTEAAAAAAPPSPVLISSPSSSSSAAIIPRGTWGAGGEGGGEKGGEKRVTGIEGMTEQKLGQAIGSSTSIPSISSSVEMGSLIGASLQSSQPSMIKTTTTTLVHDLGSFGRERGHWQTAWHLNEAHRASRLRALACSLCGVGNTTSTSSNASSSSSDGRSLNVIVYNRDSTRRLREAHQVVEHFKARLPPGSKVKLIIHREDRPICELVALLADADALVTPHGFSSMLMMFLPRRAVLVEIMPYQFNWPGYGPLAAAFGVKHVCIPSGPVRKLQPVLLDMVAPLLLPGHDSQKCKDYAWCRFVSKKFPVRLDDEDQLNRLAARLQADAEATNSTFD